MKLRPETHAHFVMGNPSASICESTASVTVWFMQGHGQYLSLFLGRVYSEYMAVYVLVHEAAYVTSAYYLLPVNIYREYPRETHSALLIRRKHDRSQTHRYLSFDRPVSPGWPESASPEQYFLNVSSKTPPPMCFVRSLPITSPFLIKPHRITSSISSNVLCSLSPRLMPPTRGVVSHWIVLHSKENGDYG